MLRAVLGCLGAGQTGAAPLEFHYVPKHASWLNMVEIQIGVLAAQCLDRRIAITRPIEPVWRRSSHPGESVRWRDRMMRPGRVGCL
jgi:DDE superfamily endonuclease